MVVMRPVHVSIASALGSGPTTWVKLRLFPVGGTETVHAPFAAVHSFEQLQLHFPPSLVSIVIESTPVNPAPCVARRLRPAARACGTDLWALRWSEPRCSPPPSGWAWLPAPTAQPRRTPRAQRFHRR